MWAGTDLKILWRFFDCQIVLTQFLEWICLGPANYFYIFPWEKVTGSLSRTWVSMTAQLKFFNSFWRKYPTREVYSLLSGKKIQRINWLMIHEEDRRKGQRCIVPPKKKGENKNQMSHPTKTIHPPQFSLWRASCNCFLRMVAAPDKKVCAHACASTFEEPMILIERWASSAVLVLDLLFVPAALDILMPIDCKKWERATSRKVFSNLHT